MLGAGGYRKSSGWAFRRKVECVVCVCVYGTCPPVTRGSVSITLYQSLNLTPQ